MGLFYHIAQPGERGFIAYIPDGISGPVLANSLQQLGPQMSLHSQFASVKGATKPLSVEDQFAAWIVSQERLVSTVANRQSRVEPYRAGFVLYLACRGEKGRTLPTGGG